MLLGEPGSGKTTTLYKLALDAARERLAGGEARIPLYLPLADYRGYASPHAFVATRWRQQVGREDVESYLREGQLLLLCDALNEMPFKSDRDYRARVGAWQRFIKDWPGNQVLFTCRSRDYSEPLGLHQVEIKRLDDARVQEFLTRYVPDHAPTAWERLQDSPLLDLVRNPYYLWMLVYLIEQGGAWPQRLADLFRSFVRVLLRREARRGHPDWPGREALEAALASLAETLQPQGRGTRIPRAEAQRLIPTEVNTREGAVPLAPATVLRLGLAATLLDTEWGTDAAGQKVEQIRFYHHQLQEYFAARALVTRFCAQEDLSDRWQQPRFRQEMPDPGPLGDNEPLPPPPTTGWEEPTILAVGLAPQSAAFIEAVRQVNPVLAARCLDEGRLILPDVVDKVRSDLLQDMGDKRIHLRARIASGEALGQVGDPRFEGVEVQGHRVLVPPLVEIPGGTYWVGSRLWRVLWLALRGFTPARDEIPRHRVTLPTFYLSRYPVTNAEYACFVEAGGYADERYWPTLAARAWLRGEGGGAVVQEWMNLWQALQADPEKRLAQAKRSGWTSRQLEGLKQLAAMEETEMRTWAEKDQAERPRDRPAYWDDTRFNNPAQPVVGVTWFEALAYTRWLEEQLQVSGSRLKVWKDGRLVDVNVEPGGLNVHLPSEVEWEAGARGQRGRWYPWGGRWQAGRANTWEGHVLRPTPVSVYPQGQTPEGLHDMAGNVWEWTRSLYQAYPYAPEDGREALEAEGYRVLRGGSWDLDRRLARCAYRNRFIPDVFSSNRGFRVVVSLVRR